MASAGCGKFEGGLSGLRDYLVSNPSQAGSVLKTEPD
jgi:hypothetical protein